MADARSSQSITDLFGAVADHARHLIRNEYLIARTEIGDSIARAAGGAGLMFAGAVLVIPAVTIFLAGLALLLGRAGLALDSALLIVGLAMLLLGGALAWSGLQRAKKVKLVPEKALHQIKKDVHAVTEMRPIHERTAA